MVEQNEEKIQGEDTPITQAPPPLVQPQDSPQGSSKKDEPTVKHEANIQYVRRIQSYDKDPDSETFGKSVSRTRTAEEVPTWRRAGAKEYELPSGQEQLDGWYSEDAHELIRQWPLDFKPIVKKGVI